MHLRKNKYKKNKTKKLISKKKRRSKQGKKWTTVIEAAQKTLSKTKSLTAAKKTLKQQALTNARKLFGSVGSI